MSIIIFPHAEEEFEDAAALASWLSDMSQGKPDKTLGPGYPSIGPWAYRMRKTRFVGIVSKKPPFGVPEWNEGEAADILNALPGAFVLFKREGKIVAGAVAQSVSKLERPHWLDLKNRRTGEKERVYYLYCMYIEPNSILIYEWKLRVTSIATEVFREPEFLTSGFRRQFYILIQQPSLCQDIAKKFPHLGVR